MSSIIASLLLHVRSGLLRGFEVFGQLGGEVVAGELDVYEVHGEAELGEAEQPVPVSVRQTPDLGQDGVGELGLDHHGLGLAARQLPVLGAGGGELLRPSEE